MSGYYISMGKINDYNKTNKFLAYRGKERCFSGTLDLFSYLYNVFLLNSDEACYVNNNRDYIVFFDGVFFSSKEQTHRGMSEYLISQYKKYGCYFTKYIEGEYSLCLIDFHNSIVIFSADVFGTKPLWYSCNAGLHISSYKSSLQANNVDDIMLAFANTTYVYNFQTSELSSFQVHRFSLEQYKNTYSDWITAFENAIRKRVGNNIVGGSLSSGHDSGAIFCELIKKNYPFFAYSFPDNEDKAVLFQRIALSSKVEICSYEEKSFLRTLKHLYRHCEPYNESYFNLLKDEASVGLAQICEKLNKKSVRIYLNGYGGDETLSANEVGGCFSEDLHAVFPWKNFFGGTQHVYLHREEYVCALYGIQPRFPFLDIQLVQEFLWLDYKLKNEYYKSPVSAYFQKEKFPYHTEKIGFFVRKNEYTPPSDGN